MTIKAICFDADGVVVYPQMQFSKYLNEEHGISPAMTQPFFDGIFNNCLLGKAELIEVLPPYLKTWQWKGSVDEFIAIWLQKDHVLDARLISVIQNLRDQGTLCSLATSQECNRAEYMKTRMGFQDLFDRLFFSCEIGCQKPDPVYFEFIENSLNLEKESILFWDDSKTNVQAALTRGWKAEIYTDFTGFEKNMNKYVDPLGNSHPT